MMRATECGMLATHERRDAMGKQQPWRWLRRLCFYCRRATLAAPTPATPPASPAAIPEDTRASPPASPAEAAPTAPPEQGWQILIVEDDARTAQAIREAFQLESKAAWQVHVAPNGEEALRLLAAQPVDLVLLDVRLPGISGAEVYRRLRADPATRRLPIIFLSGVTSFDLSLEGIQEGILLRKPFNMQELLAMARANLLARNEGRADAEPK